MALPSRQVARHASTAIANLRAPAGLVRRNARASPAPIRSLSNRGGAKRDWKEAVSRTVAASDALPPSPPGSSSAAASSVGDAGPVTFGLRPIDYSVRPPVCKSPPPPPAKPGLQKYISPALMLFTVFTVGYFYVNNRNDNYEYWRAMQSGEALQMRGNVEDEVYDDDEEEEVDDGEDSNAEQTNEPNSSPEPEGGGGDTDLTRPRRRWFGWFRGWRKSGPENSSLDR